MFIKNSLMIFASFILLAGCKKVNFGSGSTTDAQPTQLPDTTHIGANTFGCLIDGKVYALSGKYNNSSPNGIGCNPYLSQNWLYIGAGDVMSLNCYWAGKPGTFTMDNNYPYQGLYWVYNNGTAITGNNEFTTDAKHTGAVTVRYFDTSIIAGTFYFDCVNDSGRVVHITDGRFDIKL